MKLKRTTLLLLFTIVVGSLWAQDKPEVKIGGALRYNYNLSSWKNGQQKRGGDLGFDLFRINVAGKYKGVKVNAEYRLYSADFGGGMLKQGWIGYDFNQFDNIQLGLTQVPFGITMYNSHSFFFSMNYYVGLEDDYDMGIKYSHKGEHWEYALAFFKNAEELRFGSSSDVSDDRYSYDVSSIEMAGKMQYRNKEINQGNAQLMYKFKTGKTSHRVGASAEYGGLYNLDTEKVGNHWAYAVHYELNSGPFDLKAQYSAYKYNPKNPTGEDNKVVAMTAFGYPYLTAAKASLYTLGMGYSVPVSWGPVSNLLFYNDFSYMDKISDFEDSMMNVTGVMVTAGNVYTYVDYAMAKNQSWLGDEWTNALGAGTKGAKWESRFNINIGYYF